MYLGVWWRARQREKEMSAWWSVLWVLLVRKEGLQSIPKHRGDSGSLEKGRGQSKWCRGTFLDNER